MNQNYAELAELAGGFIHEIKNQLGTLGLNLQLLAEDFDDPQNAKERRALSRVQKLQAQCQNITDISNDFLRFARINALDLEPTDPTKIIEEMVDFFAPTAKQADIEIKSFLPACLPQVSLNHELFKQAVLNLMLNAEQAMPEGGEITIQATTELSASAHENNGEPCSMVVLHVIDNGKGMTKEVLSRIFQPFFSTKKGGSGLGLPTTRRIIEAHGGTLQVESEPGRGTKFVIRLPAVTSEVVASSQS